MVFSYFFVMQWGMEAAGVAWGTVIAQYSGVLLALGLFFYKYSHLLEHIQRAVLLKKEAFMAFMKINSDIFIRTFFPDFRFWVLL
jgi:MATE family multidrug resistance protein